MTLQKSYTSQRTRINFFLTLFLFVFGLIIFRLFQVQVLSHDYYSAMAQNQHWVTRKITADRGKIYARDIKTGEKFPLATNKELKMSFAVPNQIKDKKKTATEVASILSLKEDEVFDLINNDKVYVVLKHKLSDDEVSKVEKSSLEGILLSDEDWREYPEGELASQVLGFVNNEGEGQYGIEEYLNSELTGKSGEISMERDSTGMPIVVGGRFESPAQNGQDVTLTIDRIIQSFAEKELKDTVEKFQAIGGSIIVMDPNNGEILAMSNYPTFDPNNFSDIKNFDLFKNSSISGGYEPGSIFKIITMASGVDSGKVTPKTVYTDTGLVQIGGYSIRNSDGKANGVQTMTQVLEKSLNTGSYFVKEQLGDQQYYEYLKKFGFGEKTGVELSNEFCPVLKSYQSLKDINFATMAFGQGIAVTPVQFITAASAIANGGELIEPTIISEYTKSDGSRVKPSAKKKIRIISKDSANMVGAMMVSVVENGHGKAAKIAGFRIAGKTGTAEIPATDGEGYQSGKNIGSFVLFTPAENPRFIILVKIDEPKGVQWAESTAAPAAGHLAKKILEYLEVSPSN